MTVRCRMRYLLIMCFVLCLCSGCPRMQQLRDRQIATSHSLPQGDRVVIPDPPLSIPAQIKEQLPLDPQFQYAAYHASTGNSEISLTAVSPWDVTATCQWMLTRMQERGYGCDENPSEILNGIEFYSQKQAYSSVTVQVTMNTADQCLIHIKALRNP